MLTVYFKNKIFFLAETLVLILLLLLLAANPYLLAYRYWFLLIGLIYFWLFICTQNYNWSALGFRSANFIPAVKVLVQPTILAILIIIVLFRLFPVEQIYPLKIPGVGIAPIYVSVLRYGFVSVTLQEIIFRSFLISRAGLVIKNQLLLQIYAVTMFMLIHIPFKTAVLTFGSMIIGWIWSGNFIKYRNIYSVALSHIAVGLTYIIFMYLAKP